MRFVGFFLIREWDGTKSRVSVNKKKADLADYLKYKIDYWVHICYSDGLVHRMPQKVFDRMVISTVDPNPYCNGAYRR